MLMIILALLFITMVVVALTKKETYDNEGYLVTSFVLGAIGFIAVIVVSILGYTQLINKESEYFVMNDKLQIQNERRENVTNQLKVEVTNYIAYEKSVFDKIQADNVNSILFQYPELKTIESIKILMEQIAKLNEGYYQMLFAKKDYEAYFRSVNMNKFSIYKSDY